MIEECCSGTEAVITVSGIKCKEGHICSRAYTKTLGLCCSICTRRIAEHSEIRQCSKCDYDVCAGCVRQMGPGADSTARCPLMDVKINAAHIEHIANQYGQHSISTFKTCTCNFRYGAGDELSLFVARGNGLLVIPRLAQPSHNWLEMSTKTNTSPCNFLAHITLCAQPELIHHRWRNDTPSIRRGMYEEAIRFGEYEEAMECCRNDLVVCQRTGDEKGASKVYGNMGIVCAALGQYEKAIECYEKTLAVCQRTGDEEGMSKTYSNMGSVYDMLGQYEEAIKSCEKNGDLSADW